jgi:F-type H+-transporting ATPase subunit b
MQERERKISEGLAAADQASQDLELAKEKAVERLREAKEEAAGIIEAANRRASQIVEEAKDAATVEAERIKTAAQAEIEQESNRAREQLRGQVAPCRWPAPNAYSVRPSMRRRMRRSSTNWPRSSRGAAWQS